MAHRYRRAAGMQGGTRGGIARNSYRGREGKGEGEGGDSPTHCGLTTLTFQR